MSSLFWSDLLSLTDIKIRKTYTAVIIITNDVDANLFIFEMLIIILFNLIV